MGGDFGKTWQHTRTDFQLFLWEIRWKIPHLQINLTSRINPTKSKGFPNKNLGIPARTREIALQNQQIPRNHHHKPLKITLRLCKEKTQRIDDFSAEFLIKVREYREIVPKIVDN